MTFRTRLFVIFALALVLSVGLVAAGVTVATRRAFEELNRQHSDALVAQFEREFERRGQDVVERVQGIRDEQATQNMAVSLSLPRGDPSIYVNDAVGDVDHVIPLRRRRAIASSIPARCRRRR